MTWFEEGPGQIDSERDNDRECCRAEGIASGKR